MNTKIAKFNKIEKNLSIKLRYQQQFFALLSCLGLDNQFRLVFSKHILTPNTASLKIQRKLSITQQIERQTVIRCGATSGNSCAMLLGWITFVVVPVVVRELFVQVVHIVVAVGLGQNRGCSDGEELAIALYHHGMGDAGIGLEAVAVDEQVLGTYLQLGDGTVHGQERGVEDVDFINLLRGDDTHRPGQSLAFDDLAQGITLVFGQLLGVVEPLVAEVLGQDDGSSIYGSGQATAARFVATGFQKSGIQIGK